MQKLADFFTYFYYADICDSFRYRKEMGTERELESKSDQYEHLHYVTYNPF